MLHRRKGHNDGEVPVSSDARLLQTAPVPSYQAVGIAKLLKKVQNPGLLRRVKIQHFLKGLSHEMPRWALYESCQVCKSGLVALTVITGSWTLTTPCHWRSSLRAISELGAVSIIGLACLLAYHKHRLT